MFILTKTFASTCINSADADLLTIQINGRQLTAFDANTLTHNYVSDELPQVTAYTNFPFANHFKYYQQDSKVVIINDNNLAGEIQIYNTVGQCVHDGKLKNNAQNEYVLHQSGVYLVNISTSEEVGKFKFIMQ